VPEADLPCTECLKDTVTRFLPYWSTALAPSLSDGRNLIVAAQGNTLRALVKYRDGISDADIPALEIPIGIPLVYELNENCARWHVTIWAIRRRLLNGKCKARSGDVGSFR
jgi:2,3-bisphosphoglycerate-dependent phosphoglycerate mutase